MVVGADPDGVLVLAVQAGDQGAFAALVRRHHAGLLRVAETMVPCRAVAEEVVQDTWLGVLRGIERFEGRSSVRTWLFHILVRRARSAGSHEHRNLPLGDVDPVDGPAAWVDAVVDRLAAEDLAARVRRYLPDLPDTQRRVLVGRDVEGLCASEVCDLLGVSAGNQRVLLHRARTRLRATLEAELAGASGG